MDPQKTTLKIFLRLSLLSDLPSLRVHLSGMYQPVIDVECESIGVINNYQNVDPAKKPRFDVSDMIRSPNKRYLAAMFSFNDDGANYNTASKSNPTPSAKVESAASSGKISDEVPLDTELPEYSNSLDSAILDLLSGRDTKLEITRVNELKGRPSNLQTSAHPSLFRFGFESTAKGTMELPDREMADRLVDEYFIHTNLHVPVLNRPDFEKILDRIYDSEGSDYPKDQLYFAFIVFAIGAASVTRSHEVNPGPELHFGVGSRKRKRSSIEFRAAEEYHASAITCLEHCLDSCGNFNLFGDFEGLQALILLCSFALFKSTSPGLGNLLDIAIRSAIDLRLYIQIAHLMKHIGIGSKIYDEDSGGVFTAWIDWSHLILKGRFLFQTMLLPLNFRPY
ncbi:unnamed protein product [Penicillium manginii]